MDSSDSQGQRPERLSSFAPPESIPEFSKIKIRFPQSVLSLLKDNGVFMDDSKFNLWRACFSFCFVDGFLDPAEKNWIEEKLNHLKFTDEQKKTLLTDLNNPPAIDKLLPLITKPADRGFLVNNLRQLSKLDLVLSDSEKAKIQAVRDAVVSKIDMAKLDQIIAEDEKASYHEDEVYKVHNKSSYVERTVRELQKFLNPGDYKFPDKY